MAGSRWSSALDLVARRGGRWQLVVWQHDRRVIDARMPADGPDLFWLWSAGKPFLALLIWQLAEQGVLRVDDPVAGWWPEFGRRGKSEVTIRQVLAHRSGVPHGPGGHLVDALVMTNWRWSVHRLAGMPPKWPAGQRAAYHYLSQGFLLGEVARRATGRELPELLAERVFRPLGMADTRLGLGADQLARAVPIRAPGPWGFVVERLVNAPRTRRAVIPAGGVSGTANDLAGFYRALLGGGRLAGGRIISPGTLAQMCQPTSDDGRPDGLLHHPVRWAQGFQLGGPALGSPAVEPFGRLSSPLAFGQNGSNVCLGYADPVNGLAVGFVSDLVTGPQRGRRFVRDLGDALARAADGPGGVC